MRLLGGDTNMNKAQEVTVNPVVRSETCWALPNVYGFLYLSSTQLMDRYANLHVSWDMLANESSATFFQVPFVSTFRSAWPATWQCLAEKPLFRPSYSREIKHSIRKQLMGFVDGVWSRLGGGKWWSNDKNQWQMTERERGGSGANEVNDRKGSPNALISNHNLHFWTRTSLQTQFPVFIFFLEFGTWESKPEKQ